MKKALTYIIILIVAVPLIRWVLQPKVRPEFDNKGRVIIEWYNYATPEFLELYEKYLIPEFERTHPHIKIRLNSSMGDTGYDAKLLTLIAGNIAPDIFHVTQQNFPFYAAKGLLVDLNPVIAKDPSFDIDDYFEQVMDGLRYQDQLLGLPSDFSAIAMVYNKKLFDEAGVPYPDDTWTWDTFLKAARKLTRDTDGDGAIDQFGFVNVNSYNRWPAWVWANGGDILSADAKKCLMDDPKSIEGLKFYVNLSLKEHVAPTSGQNLGQSFEEMFMAQRAAMIADSRYAYKLFSKGLEFPWDIAHMPKGPAGRATTFIWGGNCILKTTKHPKEAWEFLKFVSGYEGALLNVKAGNAFPAYKKVAMSDTVLKSPISPPSDHIFIEAIEYGRQAPFPAQFTEFNQAMTNFEAAWLGYGTVDNSCRKFTSAVNAAIGGEVW